MIAVDTCIVWIMPAKESIDHNEKHDVYIIKECDGTVYRSYDKKYAKHEKVLSIFNEIK